MYGKNYAMTGHISTRDDACTMITYFNKAMIAAYNLPSPYTLVETEEWTFDQYGEMVRAVSVDVNMPLLAVPVNVPDAEKTGAVLETMAWESLYTLTPVYNETLLKRKHARDTESADMLTLISRSRTYNLAAITDWGGLYSIGGEKFYAGKPLAVSDLEKKLAAANKAMEKDMEAFTAQQ